MDADELRQRAERMLSVDGTTTFMLTGTGRDGDALAEAGLLARGVLDLLSERDRLAADNAVLRLETAALREQVGRLHEAAAGGCGDA